jgi:hypothetical protein
MQPPTPYAAGFQLNSSMFTSPYAIANLFEDQTGMPVASQKSMNASQMHSARPRTPVGTPTPLTTLD